MELDQASFNGLDNLVMTFLHQPLRAGIQPPATAARFSGVLQITRKSEHFHSCVQACALNVPSPLAQASSSPFGYPGFALYNSETTAASTQGREWLGNSGTRIPVTKTCSFCCPELCSFPDSSQKSNLPSYCSQLPVCLNITFHTMLSLLSTEHMTLGCHLS